MSREPARFLPAAPPIAALVAAVLLAGPEAASAQDAAVDTAAEDPLVEVRWQFRPGPTLGVLSWREPGAGAGERIDDAIMWGVDVASVVGRYAGFRLGGAVGLTSISRGEAEMDAVQYLADVSIEGRIALDPLLERGVVPYATVGVGTTVHDPAPDSLITRSHSTFTWGGGVELRLRDRIGARAEWRRVQGELQSVFDPVDRSGTTRFADRWFLGAYWVF